MNKIQLQNPLNLQNGIVIPNRFVKSATSEQLGDKKRDPRPELGRLYQAWSEGGAGLLISGNIMVDRTAIGEPFNVVLDEDSNLNAFRAWTDGATTNGNQFWAQINHPGKQSPKLLSKAPMAPSAIPLDSAIASAFNPPTAMSEADIMATIARFATAARLAKQVGFTGVQIHGAHGYLVNQFMSPKHNIRTDKWGGSLENRMRFGLEIYHAVRKEVGDDFPVAIKLNSADFQKGGFSEEESMQVIEALVSAGIDFVEISGGSYESPAMVTGRDQRQVKASTRKREAYFLHYAETLRERTNIPLAVTGGFRTGAGMAEAVASGATDMVGMARPMILKPDLPNTVLSDPHFVMEFKEPTTGFPALDAATMMVLIWYEKQMWRVARGLKTKPALSPWMAALTSIWKVITKPPARLRG